MLTSAIDNLFGRTLGMLRHPTNGAVVLLYHRVVDLSCDPQLLAVSPRRFDEQMRLLAREFTPISLQELASCVRRGIGVPKRAVVVTFDDGYEDNLTHAKPILETYSIPATVFVASGAIGNGHEFYWDKLQDVFLTDRPLPSKLSATVISETYHVDLGTDAGGYREHGWDVLSPNEPGPRQAAYLKLCDKLRPLPHDQQLAVITELCRWAGIDQDARPTHRAMTGDQVRQLADGGLVEIGAHTIDHPILATLPADTQRRQIRQSKDDLEQIIDQAVRSFSYPYGTRSSYSGDTIDAVKDAGFTCACSNYPGTAGRGADPYQLPRVLVRDWSAQQLNQEVRRAAA